MILLFDILYQHIAPILVAVGLGTLFGWVFKPDLKTLARLAFYVLSPCLVFSGLTTTNIPADEALRLVGFTVAVVVAAGGLAWCVGRVLKLSSSLTAALMLSCMFVNAGNYGLALNQLAFGEAALARALIFYMVSTMLVYSLGVVVASNKKPGAISALAGMLKVPALYALGLAGLTRGLGWPIPQIVERPVSLLGQGAIPVMLLILGIQIGRARWSGSLSWIGLIVGIRLLIMPAVAAGFSAVFQLSGPALQAAITQAAMPTAVIVTVLALEYDVEPDLITKAVVATTIISPITLALLIAFLQG